MNKRLFILFILTLIINSVFAYSLNAQSRMDSLRKITQLIQKHNIVSSEGVGYALAPSKHWYAFGYLLYLATNEELEQMTHDNSAALRIYSYFGLLHNQFSNLKDAKKKLLNDTESVNTSFGCIVEEMEVSKCSKLFSKYYYNENAIDSLLATFKNNETYRKRIYDDLINNRKIQRNLD